MPSQLEEASARFRRQLLVRERAAAAEMVRAYGASWTGIQRQIDQLTRQIETARSMGMTADAFRPRLPGGPPIRRTPGTFSPNWIWQRDRLASLQRQIEGELRQFASFAGELTDATQRQVVEMAVEHSTTLIETAASTGVTVAIDKLPRAAIEDLVGFASDGSPLRTLFEQIGPGVAQRMIGTFTTALAAGQGPRALARLMRDEYALGLHRALVIARTEQLRAYREATRRNYVQNNDILDGWTWLSAADGRTCPSCWAMHGTHHSTEEKLDDHPQGRCTMLPRVKGHKLNITPGTVLFAQLPEKTQQRILGKAATAAYRAGAVKLEDFVGRKDDPRWGTMRYARSLQDVLGEKEAKRWIRMTNAPKAKKAEVEPVKRAVLTPEQARIEIKRIGDEAQGRIEELYAKRDALDYGEARVDATNEIVNAKRERDEKLRAVLKVSDPADVSITYGKGLTPGLYADWEDGIQDFTQLVSKQVIPGKESVLFHRTSSDRSYFLPGNSLLIGTVNMSRGAGKRTVVHELGHWLEKLNPVLHQKTLDFYDRRTKGEKLTWLGRGYARHEKTRADQFINPYMGKDYGRDATEIVSMGLEYMYANAIEFAEKDPDYFDFIYNLVRGIW